MIIEAPKYFVQKIADMGLSPPLVMGVIQYQHRLFGTSHKYFLGVGSEEKVREELQAEMWRVYDNNK